MEIKVCDTVEIKVCETRKFYVTYIYKSYNMNNHSDLIFMLLK